jgi:hypothetical protein
MPWRGSGLIFSTDHPRHDDGRFAPAVRPYLVRFRLFNSAPTGNTPCATSSCPLISPRFRKN